MILARWAAGPTEAPSPSNGEGGKAAAGGGGGTDGVVVGSGGGGGAQDGGGVVGVTPTSTTSVGGGGGERVGDGQGQAHVITGIQGSLPPVVPADGVAVAGVSAAPPAAASSSSSTSSSIKSPRARPSLGKRGRRSVARTGSGSGASTSYSYSSASSSSTTYTLSSATSTSTSSTSISSATPSTTTSRRSSARITKTTPPSSAAASRATSVSPPIIANVLSSASSSSTTPLSSTSSSAASRKVFPKSMEPPVVSFYGAEPIPLPSRFAGVKKRLIAGREAAVEASWRRLLDALRTEIADIQRRGSDLVPTINFSDINDPVRVEAFAHRLRRYGVAIVRGVVSPDDAKSWVRETHDYLDKNREFKPPALHDPTCIDLFWTPVQVRARAHPNMLRAQKFAMSFWESTDDLHITRCPVSYADRLRIHNDSLGAVGHHPRNSAADSLGAAAGATVIAQIDSGSLERWEPDGYGRGGTYEAVFRGDWEEYDPWDPRGRVGATTDLYNGAGACSVFRMFQGILALTDVEQGMVRVLPSPKLVAAYFLLRPFFSPRRPPPEQPDGGKADQWAAYLHPDNWSLNPEPDTIIHGAVPGHAQRITERWHPHLHLRSSLISVPTLRPGDYVIWHCDQAYSIITGGTTLGVPPSLQSPSPGAELSLMTYTPVCPLTQTNALFLARQRKAFQTGQPGPDFDTLGGLGSEASHQDRPGAREVEEYGGVDGLRAMGLAPYDVEPAGLTASPPKASDVDGEDETARDKSKTEAETELLRLANIILFPSRYDFYIPTNGTRGSGDRTPRAVGNGTPKGRWRRGVRRQPDDVEEEDEEEPETAVETVLTHKGKDRETVTVTVTATDV
ncbi:hypothetical protein CMUS01_10974 [Colletotrichum musicola]|uniref:Duf1479 domain-containing protein n=1 Tax=Colletotrichum musicola TaxID=2175873 RepID=A0A8H6K1H0_9PEZI|nr:hypothetical protein CMUS01_10974 [Colletotrichum musicola]